MSAFWSGWIMVLVVINLAIAVFLFVYGLRVKLPQGPDGTTGHVWAHGVLREAVRPLPLWWVLVSVAAFATCFAYLYRYPGFGHYAGSLGWTSEAELAERTAANQAKFAPFAQRIAQGSVEQLAADADVVRQGARLFADNCAACHGGGGHGIARLGAPDLTDADSLYGNDGDTILASILDGRRGVMPTFTPAFDAAATEDVAHYVLSLSGAAHKPLNAQRGEARFAMCVGCHAADGTGMPALGAPNLTDAVWLYGSDPAVIARTISHGRNGVMPAWRGRMSEADAKTVAAWVYHQSHGQPGLAGAR